MTYNVSSAVLNRTIPIPSAPLHLA